MTKSKDPTARVATEAILQENGDLTRELVITDGGNGLSLAMQFDTDGVTTRLGMTFGLAELDVALDKLHEIRDALAAREDAKPTFLGHFCLPDGEGASRIRIVDTYEAVVAITDPVSDPASMSAVRAALASAGYQIVVFNPYDRPLNRTFTLKAL